MNNLYLINLNINNYVKVLVGRSKLLITNEYNKNNEIIGLDKYNKKRVE